jgi:glycosyltransferase involved in cell wall biosynthesis
LRIINNDLIRLNLSITKRRIQKVERVVVPSDYVRRVIAKELEVAAERIDVIHNGVDTNLFVPRTEKDSSPQDKKTVVFSAVLSGGLSRIKGFPHFLRLARLLSKKRNDVQFVAAGGVMSGVEPVKCVGYLSGKEMVKLYQDACLAVVLSIWDEPFGLSVTEPMACAKPTIAYASGGISEILEDGTTGFLAPTGNLSRIVEQVEYLLDNESTVKKMGANARKRVEASFSTTLMVEKYLAMIQRLTK